MSTLPIIGQLVRTKFTGKTVYTVRSFHLDMVQIQNGLEIRYHLPDDLILHVNAAEDVVSKVIANLDKTIRGKEALLAEYRVQAQSVVDVDTKYGIAYLEVNLEELRRIREDLSA